MQIVLCYPVEAHHVDQISAAAPEATLIDAGQEGIGEAILEADIFCGHAKVPVPWDQVVRQGRLQWIQSSAAGMDHCLVPSVVESEIIVTSASGVLSDQVAEHVMALITGFCRRLPLFLEAQKRKEFIRRPTRDLHHSTVGIVGLGGVGRRLAQVLAPFKVTILATDLFPVNRPPEVTELWPADRLGDMLEQVDILVLACPLTDQTRGLIDASALGRMRPDALLVNAARGPIVVERDLVSTLQAGHLAGAVMDVTEQEPLPESSPLWDLPNVIITPHVGGQSARRIDQMTDFFCDNLRRYQVNAPLRNLVDKRLGFPIPVEHSHG